MKIYSCIVLLIYFLFIASIIAEQNVATSFNTRSISRNAARDLAGWTNYINLDSSPDIVYGALSITPEYTHTFNSKRIAQTLFGDNLFGDCDNHYLKISGSQVRNRDPHDLLADYFYLPTDFESTVEFKPVIDNVIIDLGFYLGLDAWKKGMYLQIHAPLAHTRWDLNICENIIEPGVNSMMRGYFAPIAISRNQLLDSFTDFVNGESIPNTDAVAFQELRYAQMSDKRLVKTRMGEIRTALGWNFFAEPHFHVGFNGQLAWPTGLRPDAFYLFEPLVGNGHFWELGFGFNGHYDFWHSQDELKYCSFYVDINVTHLFRTRQARTFDLTRAGTLSRYMLASEMKSPAVNLRGLDGSIPAAQFNNELLPVANFTTLDVEVSVAAQADLVFMLNGTIHNWSIDFGYNYWGRSPDSITIRQNESFDERTYALKGDAHIFGFAAITNEPVALSATQDKATIYAGRNLPAQGTTNQNTIINAAKNPKIDFAQPATTNPAIGPGLPLLFAPGITNEPTNYINTSIPPIFITRNDMNINGSETSGSSNKLFGHVSYTWNDKTAWQPYLGLGGEVEWAPGTDRSCDPCDDDHPQSATSQWGIWVKTGATF